MTAMSDAKVAPGEALEEPSPASEQAAAATVATCTVNPDLAADRSYKVGRSGVITRADRLPQMLAATSSIRLRIRWLTA